MTTFFIGLICFLVAAFAIMILLFVVDIIRGAITGRKSNLAEGWCTIMEAILGYAAAAGTAILLPAIALILLYAVFVVLFG